MSSPSIIQSVVKAVDKIPNHGSFRVLDMSCGDGKLLEHLSRKCGTVEGIDFKDHDYIYRNASGILQKAIIHKNIDLTGKLPLADHTYDLIIATEVMEHLPMHTVLIREVARILKPGGIFIFTTPNIHRLASRWRFMFSGMHNLKGARLGWHIPADKLFSTHYNPVYFPVVHALLHQRGIEVNDLGLVESKPLSWLLFLLYPFICIGSYIETKHMRKRSSRGGRDLFRWMTSPKLLLSEQLMVIARKRG